MVSRDVDAETADLQREVVELRDQVQHLLRANERLAAGTSPSPPRPRLVLETFEGEAWDAASPPVPLPPGPEECAVSPDGSVGDGCPLEPDVPFRSALRDRAAWLVGLLAAQSCSGFILARNEQLLQAHPVIVYFLTMLVGAGGNAGNQASVRVIRGLALGSLNRDTRGAFLRREFKMAAALAVILSAAGFARAVAFGTSLPESAAVTAALAAIVFLSVCLGSVLPLGLRALRVDPAHASTTIQVVMDILGVLITVVVSVAMLDSPWGSWFIEAVGKMFGKAL